MRIVVLFAILLLAVFVSSKTTNEIIQGFRLDNYTVTKQIEYQGERGFEATHLFERVLSTKELKRVYFVEGTGYQMGYLTGLLMKNQTVQMATTYMRYIVPELVARDFVKEHNGKPWFNVLLNTISAFLTTQSVESWNRNAVHDPTMFPKSLISEMQGIVDACQANGATDVTMDKMIALNYGFDWLLAQVYTGAGYINDLVKFIQLHPSIYNSEMIFAISTTKSLLEPPIFCDAFGVKGKATKSGNDVFFGRDFQLQTGQVFQNINTMIIYNPTDGRIPLISATAPGLVGSISAMNAQGFAMGVDIVRSVMSNATAPGLNSILLIRHIVDNAANTRRAIQLVADSRRGLTWLYPMCDASGDCVVIEAQMYQEVEANPLLTVPGVFRSYLPTLDVIKRHSNSTWKKGIYVREMDWKLNPIFLGYNKRLFDIWGFEHNPTQWGRIGQIFGNWTIEGDYATKGLYFYFSPQREELDDVIMCTNLAIVPEMRISQMSPITAMIQRGSRGMQWRYDTMNKMILENYGKIDFEFAKSVVVRLSPKNTPGFWNQRLDPSNPSSALVEGNISVMDLKKKIITTLGGYWTDGFITLTLPRYV
jgi:hypothetical protein